MNTYFDWDDIECVRVEEARKVFWECRPARWSEIVDRFAWEITEPHSEPGLTMTLADFNFVTLCWKECTDWRSYNYDEVHHCAVCRKVLLPDAEAYTDFDTGKTLCDDHSYMDESIDAYRMCI